jgi:SAM-dependent methyltransferase
MSATSQAGNAYSTSMLSKDEPSELERLSAIQRHVDTHTIGIIEQLPIIPAADCLELGAGAGSIAYWLAGTYQDGRVVAVDIDTRYLDADRAANLEIQQADITQPDYHPGWFDLIHARYLLCHLPDRETVIKRAVGWLKPGGWIVLEEPYSLPAQQARFPVVQRVLEAYQIQYGKHGADLTWARALPAALARSGVTELSFVGNLGCMGNGDKDRWQPLISKAAPHMIDSGLLRQTDLDEFYELLTDPSFVEIPQLTISAWARKP